MAHVDTLGAVVQPSGERPWCSSPVGGLRAEAAGGELPHLHPV
ncbi:MAG: hypothetical protein ACLRSY_04530 [Acutalibacter sp.]